MPAFKLPNSESRDQTFVKVFDYGKNGSPPEEFVVPMSGFDPFAMGTALAVDDTYKGSLITRWVAGVNLTQWQTVYLLPSGSVGQWQLADADGSGTQPARGIVVADVLAGQPAKVLVMGEVRNDAWAWTFGANIYQSTTPGGLTQTAPGTNIQAVGWATSADSAMFIFTPTFRPS